MHAEHDEEYIRRLHGEPEIERFNSVKNLALLVFSRLLQLLLLFKIKWWCRSSTRRRPLLCARVTCLRTDRWREVGARLAQTGQMSVSAEVAKHWTHVLFLGQKDEK